MVVATVAYCIGGCLIGGAGIFILLNLGDHRALRTLRRVVPSPLLARTSGRVAVEGRTEYGPSGRQVGPVTGEDCVWFHVRLIREPARWQSSGETDPVYDVLLEFSSPGGFTLADHSGRIPVDPAILDHPYPMEPGVKVKTTLEHGPKAPRTLPPVVPRDLVDDLRKNERLTLTESRVPRGVQVFALGRLARGELKKSRAGVTVFTTKTRDQVIAARRDGISLNNRIIVGFALLGLALAGGGVGYLATLG